MIKFPGDRTNIVIHSDPNKPPTEKMIKEEVEKRKLGFGDLGYVVLLSDKDDRTKPNPGLLIYFFHPLRVFSSHDTRTRTKKVLSMAGFSTKDNFFATRSQNKSRWVVNVSYL